MIAQLSDSMLDVEFSEEDLGMLGHRSYGLPCAVQVPGCLEDVFYAQAAEMRPMSWEDEQPFPLNNDVRLEIAQLICAPWSDAHTGYGICFYGEDRELWCYAERERSLEVVAPRSSSVPWTLLAIMVTCAEVAPTIELALLEGVFGAALIILLITPFTIICLVAALRSWRCKVTVTPSGLDVCPAVGTSYYIPLDQIVRVERWEGSPFESVRKLVIRTSSRRVTVRRTQAGIEILAAFLESYLDGVPVVRR